MKQLLLLPLFILGCTSQVATQVNNVDSLDVGKGVSGAKLSVNISFQSFNVKVSSGGVAAKTVNDINSAKLYLTTSNGANPLLASNVKFTSPVIAYPTGTSTKTYTFFNVPAGTFFVAAELFSDSSGSTNIVEPITYTSAASGDTAFGFTGGKRGLALSTNSATVTPPAMTFSFSDSSTAFNVVPKLLNATGASLDTVVTPQAGNSTPNGVITLQ